MNKVHIVIPSYNHWELTHEILWSLYRHEKENISSILVVDNGSTDPEVFSGFKWWANADMPGCPSLDVLVIKENCGFLLAANKGLKSIVDTVSPDDVVILISNDVQIKCPFIQQICDILKAGSPSLVGGNLLDRDTGWNNVGGIIHPYLVGWFLATTATWWKDLNYFDERYAPQDFEDIDLSTDALSKGYRLAPLNNVGLIHLGARTYGYNPEREAITRINKKKFEEKWIK